MNDRFKILCKLCVIVIDPALCLNVLSCSILYLSNKLYLHGIELWQDS